MTPSSESFSFRLRFNFPSTNHIASDDEFWVLAEHPNRVELRPAAIGQTLHDARVIVIIGRGYTSALDASDAGQRWTEITMRAFSAQHLQADFGSRAATGKFTEEALHEASTATGQPVLDDVHGLMTYRTEPRPILVGAGPIVGIRGANGERLLATLRHARDTYVAMDSTSQLAYDIFSAAAIEGAADARFMMLMMALETLIQQDARSPDCLAHIQMLRDKTVSSDLPKNERHSLDMALSTLTRESVGRAGRRLAKTLGKRRYMDEPAVTFFNTCYEMRSALAHGHLDRPTRDAVSARAGSLELFVADLLAGPMIGFDQQ